MTDLIIVVSALIGVLMLVAVISVVGVAAWDNIGDWRRYRRRKHG